MVFQEVYNSQALTLNPHCFTAESSTSPKYRLLRKILPK